MDLLEHQYKELSQDDFKKIWAECTFVFDTNVLLDLYRLPKNSSSDLLAIFKHQKVIDRIWIPFQVKLEYNHMRYTVMEKQLDKFREVTESINNVISTVNDAKKKLNTSIENLKLKKEHSVIDDTLVKNDDAFNAFLSSFDKIKKTLVEQKAEVTATHNNDPVIKELSKIFKNKTGRKLTQKKLDMIYDEGEIRYANQIPPGFKDWGKKDAYVYKNTFYKKKFGDLILWYEVLDYVKKENIKNLVLVTKDTKEDWLEKRNNKEVPRYELLDELKHKCKDIDNFLIYDTVSFMKYAKEYLQVNITETSIQDAKESIQNRQEINIEVFLIRFTTTLKGAKKIEELINNHKWLSMSTTAVPVKAELYIEFFVTFETVEEAERLYLDINSNDIPVIDTRIKKVNKNGDWDI